MGCRYGCSCEKNRLLITGPPRCCCHRLTAAWLRHHPHPSTAWCHFYHVSPLRLKTLKDHTPDKHKTSGINICCSTMFSPETFPRLLQAL
ncbi:hypothetical protein CEXT_745291 [Caerostris extrusa]|uniref:Uncharacterized protein n=1 Tax=Caerostris extrusa TaxID=172846 RepID=A0AAV4VBJ6_CAEEX|nr:hypothetical protein CEXT_745291 [Caerostris extrusa]